MTVATASTVEARNETRANGGERAKKRRGRRGAAAKGEG